MSREVPFDENEFCDVCGEKGAYDFMGDCYCVECLEEAKEEYEDSDASWMKQKIIMLVKEMPLYGMFGTMVKKSDIIKAIEEIE